MDAEPASEAARLGEGMMGDRRVGTCAAFKNGRNALLSSSALIASALLGASQPAWAEDRDPSTAEMGAPAKSASAAAEPMQADPGPNQQLGDIIVTAQKRSERLQDVPVSVQVVTSETLATKNLTSLARVTEETPSVHVGYSVLGNELYVRGIGAGQNPSFDQAVGTFIDGVYYGRSRTNAATFLDLERVELLKGPQSTFFGNNAIAGAFNIVTKQPGESEGGSARALIGSYKDRLFEVAGSEPLGDKLAIRAVLHYDGTDGWLYNPFLNTHIPEQNNVAGRVTLSYKPTSDLSFTLKGEGSHNNSQGIPFQPDSCPQPAPFPTAGFCATLLGLGYGGKLGTTNNYNFQNAQEINLDTYGATFTINLQKWGQTFTSISAYTGYDYNQIVDVDDTPTEYIHAHLPERYHQFSQELRITSPSDRRLEYILGGYFQSDHIESQRVQDFPLLNGTIAGLPAAIQAQLSPLPVGQAINFVQDEQSYAAFGSASLHVTKALKLTVGLRETVVHKSLSNVDFYGGAVPAGGDLTPFDGTLNVFPLAPTGAQLTATNILKMGPAGVFTGSRTDSAFLPSGNVQYNFTRDVMVYASVAKGFLAGGFNGQNNTGIPSDYAFAPEKVTSFEVGLKSVLFDRRVTFNIDAFRGKYRDLQVTQSVLQGLSARSFVTNAASAISQGVELEAQWRVTNAFRIGGNLTYLDSHYEAYSGVTQDSIGTFCHTAANVGNAYCVSRYGGNGDPGATRDLAGQQTPFAPRWAGNVTGSYDLTIGAIQLTPQATGIYSSSYFPSGSTLNDPLTQQKAYWRLDAGLTLRPNQGPWAIDLIAKNLTDVAITQAVTTWPQTPGGVIKIKEEPRHFAVQLRLNW